MSTNEYGEEGGACLAAVVCLVTLSALAFSLAVLGSRAPEAAVTEAVSDVSR